MFLDDATLSIVSLMLAVQTCASFFNDCVEQQ